MTTQRPGDVRRVALAAALAAPLMVALTTQSPRFYPDDPLLHDEDMLHVADEPAEIELSDMFDRFGHIAPPIWGRRT